MKKIIKNSLLFVILSTLIYSCDDFIEEDITNDRISLIAPENGLITAKLTHTFGWEELEDAEQYNLVIVQGTFSTVTSFVLDTIVGSNRFSTTLFPGDFEWRVRGENNGSETDFTTFSISIDSSLNISIQEIVLSSPINLSITNNNAVEFRWNNLSNADEYLIEIYENALTGTRIFGPEVTTTTSIEVIDLHEGTLVWAVQGRNSVPSSTSFSTRTITIDTTAPNLPLLISPGNNDTIASDSNFTYQWNQGSSIGGGTPTAVTDSLYFYSDSLGTLLVNPISISSGMTSFPDTINVTHFWNVRSVDAAGNISSFSTLRKVNVTP